MLDESRLSKFKKLLVLSEQYNRKNQYLRWKVEKWCCC